MEERRSSEVEPFVSCEGGQPERQGASIIIRSLLAGGFFLVLSGRIAGACVFVSEAPVDQAAPSLVQYAAGLIVQAVLQVLRAAPCRLRCGQHWECGRVPRIHGLLGSACLGLCSPLQERRMQAVPEPWQIFLRYSVP